jgi:polyisoprenoid-binding protein YceI
MVTRLITHALLPALCFAAAAAESAPPVWDVDYDASRLGFSAVQAGARFSGRFGRFEAEIRFDPADLAASEARVTIPLASVDSQNGDRDGEVVGAAWFDVANHPTATFLATDFQAVDGGYVTTGDLTIKGRTHAVPFRFTVTPAADGRVTLDGSATLDRLALSLGTGEWTDTSWVGRAIEVEVHVVARTGGAADR